MLAGPLRQGDPDSVKEGARPQPSGNHDEVGLHPPLGGLDADDAAAGEYEARHLDLLDDARPGPARGGGIGGGEIGGVDAAGERTEPDAARRRRIEEGSDPAGLAGLEPARRDAAFARRPVELGEVRQGALAPRDEGSPRGKPARPMIWAS
jgi:hypothetical protein